MRESDQSVWVYLCAPQGRAVCLIFCQKFVEREQLFLTVVTKTSDLNNRWTFFRVIISNKPEFSSSNVKMEYLRKCLTNQFSVKKAVLLPVFSPGKGARSV